MIIYENGKIVAISKELLNLLNVSLEEISQIINRIKLETALLNQNSVEILNFTFNVKKEEMLTLKNLDVYILEKISTTSQTTEEEKPLSLEADLLQTSPQEELEITSSQKEENLPFEEDLLKIPEENQPLQMPEITISEEEKPIELNFEDNISECEKIFENKNKIKEVIKEELEIATKDLGIDENLANELFEDLLNQIKNNKEEFLKAIEEKDYEKIHKTAHFLKGASLNLRLSNLAFIFKTIDEEAKNKSDIEKIKYLVEKLYDYISPLINDTSTNENESYKKEIKKISIDPKIKNFVINTIRYYLETQDEKKFQQDKKYIEKLLNINIDSIDDLAEIIKDNR